MKKYLITLISMLLLVGCDDIFDSSSSSSNRGKRQEIIDVVVTRGLHGLERNDIMFFDTRSNRRIIATRDTRILRQTPSCSALDVVQPQNIQIGDTLIVSFYKNDSYFEYSRHVIRADRIEAYIPGCVRETEEGSLTPCELYEILNTGERPYD